MKQVCIALAICLIFISAVSATKEHEAAVASMTKEHDAAVASIRQAFKSFGFEFIGRRLAPADPTYWSVEAFSDSACKTPVEGKTGEYFILACYSDPDNKRSIKMYEAPGKGLNITVYGGTNDCSGNNIQETGQVAVFDAYHEKECVKFFNDVYVKSNKNTMPHERPGNVVVRNYFGDKCDEHLLFGGKVYDATGTCDPMGYKYTHTDTTFTVESFSEEKCKGTSTKTVLATKKCTQIEAHEGHNFFIVPQAVSGAGRLDYLTTLLVSLTFVFGVMMF